MCTISFRWTCDSSPMQAEGTVNGTPFYWRLRWGRWQFAVGDTVERAVAVAVGIQDGFRLEGEYGSHWTGEMPTGEAEALIRRCCAAWVEQRASWLAAREGPEDPADDRQEVVDRLMAERDRLASQVEELREALAPWARIGDGIPDDWKTGPLAIEETPSGKSWRVRGLVLPPDYSFAMPPLIRDYRRAAAMLRGGTDHPTGPSPEGGVSCPTVPAGNPSP